MAGFAGQQVNLGSAYGTLELRSKISEGLKEAEAELAKADKSFTSKLDSFGTGARKAGTALTAGLTVPIVGGFALAVKSAIGFEDTMADVGKTTGLLGDDLEGLGGDLREFSRQTRTPLQDIVDIAIEAGRLGIGSQFIKEGDFDSARKEILEFTKATDLLVVALGDEFVGGADEATNRVGILRNVLTDFKTDDVARDMGNIANALNVLAADGLASAGGITEFSNRISGLGTPLGVTAGQIFGLSASLEEMGIAQERGGTAVTNLFKIMAEDSAGVAKTLGLPVKEFTKLVNEDMNGALLLVSKTVSENADSNEALAGMLDALGVSGIGVTEVLAKLGPNVDRVSYLQDLATEALTNQNSILDENARKQATTQANIDRLKNSFSVIAGVIGDEFLPVMVDIIEKVEPIITKLMEKFGQLSDNNKKLVAIFLLVGVVVGPVLIAIGLLASGIGVVIGVISTLAPIVGVLAAAFIFLIYPLINVFKKLKENEDTIKQFVETAKKAFTDFKNKAKEVWDGIKAIFDLITTGDYAGAIFDAFGLAEDNPLILKLIAFREFFATLPENIRQKWEEIKTAFSNGVEAVVGFMVALPGRLLELIKLVVYNFFFTLGFLWVWLPAKTSEVIESMVMFFSELPGKILAFLVELKDRVVAEMMELKTRIILELIEVGTWLLTNIPIYIDNVVTFFSELPGKIYKVLSDLYTRVKERATATGTTFSNTLNSYVDRVIAFFSQLPGKIREFIDKIPGAFREGLDGIEKVVIEFTTKAFSWGVNLVNSLVNGIKSVAGNIKKAFTDGMDAAKNSLKGNSPPKEGPFKNIDIWGRNIGEAWSDAFTSGASNIKIPDLPSGSVMSGVVSSVPKNSSSSMAGSVVNINVDAGLYAGTPQQTREIAKTIFDAFSDVALAKGVKLDFLKLGQ
jgi:TP901 family phage tail tape measure protein